jgi:hypothetical protein
MSDRVETLGHLFDPDGKGLRPEGIAALDGSEAMLAIRAALAALPSGALADLAHSAAEALRTALALKIGDVLAKGWNTGRKVLKHRDSTSTDVVDVPVAEHTIRSTHEPRVAVLVNDVQVGEIPFTVTLALTIESVVLRLRGGYLIGASPARCKGKGTLTCGKAVLLEVPSRTFSLPDLTFDPGIKIA